MKTVIIKLKEDEIIYSQKVPVNCIININSSFVDISNHLHKDDLGALVQFEHNKTISILNLTDVTPYILLFFDNELCFNGASYSLNKERASYMLQTEYKTILFIKYPNNLRLNNIENLSYE